MVKLHKIILFVFMLSILACSSEEDANTAGNDEISNSPVSGILFGENFQMNSNKARNVELFDVPSIQVYLSSEDLGCAVAGTSGYPISITAPRSVGVHTTNVFANFNDPTSDDFSSISNGITIEIISITESTVVGKVKVTSLFSENSLNGKFESTFCD